jgi:hypothetical protein
MFDENGNFIRPQQYGAGGGGSNAPMNTMNNMYRDTMQNSGFSGGSLGLPNPGGAGQGVLSPANNPGFETFQEGMGNLGGPASKLNSVKDSGGGGMFENMLGADGWGNLALGGLQTGLGAYMGFKQLGAAKDQLNFQKESFNKNYAAQKRTTNAEMRDRQVNRNASQPGQHQKADAYMTQNGIR